MGAHIFGRWFRLARGAADTSADASGDTAAAGTTPSDLIGNSKQLLATLLLHVRTRLELLGIELAIEKSRLIRSLIAGALTGCFAFMTLCLGVLYIVARYWDTPYRLLAVAWLMAGAFMLTIIAAAFLVHRMRVPSVLFSASAAELGRDVEALDNG
ncbi:MAG: rane protein [Rhodocyclales bacterium]|nr:rane protein [Rhodocyclales bacterium]